LIKVLSIESVDFPDIESLDVIAAGLRKNQSLTFFEYTWREPTVSFVSSLQEMVTCNKNLVELCLTIQESTGNLDLFALLSARAPCNIFKF
jgi:hypothetical protein